MRNIWFGERLLIQHVALRLFFKSNEIIIYYEQFESSYLSNDVGLLPKWYNIQNIRTCDGQKEIDLKVGWGHEEKMLLLSFFSIGCVTDFNFVGFEEE